MGKARRNKREIARQPPPPPTARTEEAPPSAKQTALICAALIALVLLVFGRATLNGFIDFDDPDYVSRNAVVQRGLTADGIRYAFTSVRPYYWQPLIWLSFELDCSLFGPNPGAMHLENVLLHGLTAALLFLFLQRAAGRTAAALAAAAIWAVHPLRVESVAWTVERKDVLSGVFFMATLLAYERFVRQRSAWRYALMVAMFAFSLMSKVTMVATPLILFLLNWWPFRRLDERNLREVALESLAPAVLTIPIAAAALAGQRGAIAPLSLSLRLANAIYGTCAYLGKMVVPARLAIMYPFRDIGLAAIGWAALLALLTAGAWLLRSSYPYLATGWGWYLASLFPVSGIVQTGAQSIADRLTYIPSIGVIIAIVWLIADLKVVSRTVAMAAATLAVVVFGVISFNYVTLWRDTITLFSHAAEVTEDNSVAHMIVGNALMGENRPDEANAELAEAVRAGHGASMPLASAGAAFVQQKRYIEAIEPLQRAIDADAHLESAQENLAVALLNTGRAAAALPHLEVALRLDPRRAVDITALRGEAKLALGRPDEAIADFKHVATARPSAANWNDLASAYATKNDFADAERAYREAIRIDPKAYDPRMNLAAMLSRAGRNEEALADVKEAVRFAPESIEPRVYLALIEAQLGRRAEAANDATEAMRIDAQKANEYFTKALRLPPKDTNLADFVTTMRAR